jgi:acetyl-CoA carboxylase/biotin carboxylase 1
VAYQTSKADAASGMRLSVNGKTVAFSPDYDPSSLRTDVAGKLVKKLVSNGAHVKKGSAYAEIEVMKMFMPLKVEESGVITWANNEGAALAPGDLLATLELENPENVSTATVFEGDLDVMGWGSDADTPPTAQLRPHITLRKAMDRLKNGMAGYVLSSGAIDSIMKDIASAVADPSLPAYEIDDQLSVLNGRIDGALYDELSKMTSDKTSPKFPADQFKHLIAVHMGNIKDEAERASFLALTAPLVDAADPYTKSLAHKVPGAERALNRFLDILREWVSVERWFCDGISYADAVDNMRKTTENNSAEIINLCRAHALLKSTSSVILNIIDSIAEAGRTDASSTTMTSVVLGAEGLVDATPILTDIASMRGNEAYDILSQRCRNVLIEESLPSIEERKSKVIAVAKTLAHGMDDDASRQVQELINDNIVGSDILLPMLRAATDVKEQLAMLEITARKQHRTFDMKEVSPMPDQGTLKFTYCDKPKTSVFSSRSQMTSMTDLTRAMSSSKLSDMSRSDSESSLKSQEDDNKITKTAVTKICNAMSDIQGDMNAFKSLLEHFPQYNGSSPRCESGPPNVLSVLVLQDYSDADQDRLAQSIEQLLARHLQDLEKADIRRVSFIVSKDGKADNNQYPLPSVFTFRETHAFKEDHLYRDIEPTVSYQLEMLRIAKNFSLSCLGDHLSPSGQIYLYKATPKASALAQDKKANKGPRIFARAVSFINDFSAGSFEQLLIEAFNALEAIKTAVPPGDNHLFINIVSAHKSTVIDPVAVEQVVSSILKRHSERTKRLGIAEVEAKAVCKLADDDDSHPISLRLVASNPTGFVQVMNTYVEAADDSGGTKRSKRVFKSIGGTKASMAGSGDSSWEGLDITTPYPLTRPFDAQRKAALRSSDTLYCYDLPALFEAAVENQWTSLSSGTQPTMVMFTTELVVRHKSGGSWTMQDYMNGELELVETQRNAGKNDVGMVAWLMTIKTVECPTGRQVVLIANDITHKAGSFGTREDVVFKLASEFSRKRRIPRLYMAANSGARIGLAEGIKKTFKVAFKDPSNPESGFDFLYVSKSDYERLGVASKELIAEPATINGEAVFKITDIIGAEPDLGVENLKGSGLIAGETSSAYDDIFTLTIVLGRTVGIGAYLVRLGQRTIQKNTNSPIILTGYQALNKLMGVDVYSTNDQLGGPAIMYSNGISHIAENDHLSAVTSAIHWLSYVPTVRGGLLPITDITGVDEIERPITFVPEAGVPYDPRFLLTGREDDNGEWHGGFFDKGSFTETLAGWAKTVVVGRARLGGIPMGVIATENRIAEAIKPADPADLRASEAVIQEAGGVWFPNSAYKTAQAINDFRTEDLPLIIFANWRGFSGGQRDMFDEVLKYGSLIVDAFVKFQQPVFVYIPPHAEIRGGAWVVLDASINESVMEMYASADSARGGVLEANGAASVKYRTKDLLATMHRLDDKLKSLDAELQKRVCEIERQEVKDAIKEREQALLPVYEQVAVQFCELHDTPGRMKAVGVIERAVEWKGARSYFYWRLRRKLAEFDLRKKILETFQVGRGDAISPVDASRLIKNWFLETPGATELLWSDDKAVLSWMAQQNEQLEMKILKLNKENVVQEVFDVMTSGGNTAKIGTAGIIEGISQALLTLPAEEQASTKEMIKSMLQL